MNATSINPLLFNYLSPRFDALEEAARFAVSEADTLGIPLEDPAQSAEVPPLSDEEQERAVSEYIAKLPSRDELYSLAGEVHQGVLTDHQLDASVPAPRLLIPQDATRQMSRTMLLRALPYVMPLALGTAWMIDPSVESLEIAAASGLGVSWLYGKGMAFLDSLFMQMSQEKGTPASFNTLIKAIVLLRPDSAPIMRMLLAHETVHYHQARHHLYQGRADRALMEGPAIGYEHLIARRHAAESPEYDEFRVLNERDLLATAWAGLREILDKPVHPDLAVLQERGEKMWAIQPDHALGLAAYRLAENRHGPGIYRDAMRGNLGFFAP